MLNGDAAGGDYAGTLYALTGLVLIGLAFKLAFDAFRDRAPRAATGSSARPNSRREQERRAGT